MNFQKEKRSNYENFLIVLNIYNSKLFKINIINVLITST